MGAGSITISQDDLKMVIKESFIEVLMERKDLLEQAVIEAIEDIGLAHAVAEGIKSPSVSESEIFKALDDVK
jgi:aspartate aminotransferase-like enzyme